MKFLKKAMLLTLLTTTIHSICSLYAMDPPTPDRGSSLRAALLKTGNPRSNPSSPGRLSIQGTAHERTPLTGATITREANRLASEPVFTRGSASHQSGTHYTSLGKILTAHDQMGQLIESARRQGGLRDTKLIPSETFTNLQKLEKALRKMIHLTWGALMLEGEDFEKFKEVKSAPFLYRKEGFEGTFKSMWFGIVRETEDRPATAYSFPDSGDTNTYVRQIREIATALGIDLEAEINLHFHPIEKKFRKKMAEAYHKDFPDTSIDDAYCCMLKIIKFRPEPTMFTPGVSPVLPDEGDPSVVNTVFTTPRMNKDRRTPASSFASVSPEDKLRTELPAVRNQIKFDLLMDEGIAASIDEGRARRLILNIVNRLNGIIVPAVPSSAASMSPTSARGDTDSKTADDDVMVEIDPFSHRDFINLPYGTPLKPTTTAAYRASESALRAYWERTEAALASAEAIIRSDRDASARANIEESVSLPIEDRVRNLVTYTLFSIQNYTSTHTGITWSPLVNHMLPKLRTPRGAGNVTYAWTTGEIGELEKLLPTQKVSSRRESNGFDKYPLGKTETEVRMSALEALVAEYTTVTKVRK